jgi:cyclase
MTSTTLNRRVFLQGLTASSGLALLGFLPGVLSGYLPGVSAANAASATTLSAQKLTDRLTLITGAGGNVVLYKGDAGLTLIDSGQADQANALLALIDDLSAKAPIKTLFNTHWHEDHTGGNEALHARGANIIAHENTKLWLGAEFDVEWRNWNHQPRPTAALPDQTFYTDGKLDLGGETVQYGNFAQAHTDGDLYLYFPQSNVLVAGGLLANKQYPIADIATGGWIGGLITANKNLLAMINDNTVIIPDHGPVQTKADLQAQHDMLADLYEKMKELARDGHSGPEMLKANVTANYDAKWGNPEEFVMETYRGMWAHTYDMGGFI